MDHNLEILTCSALKLKMDYPILIVWTCLGKFIRMKRVNDTCMMYYTLRNRSDQAILKKFFVYRHLTDQLKKPKNGYDSFREKRFLF